MARVLTPSANILVPLFVDGTPEYTLAISLGVMRPPLTLWELDVVERVIGRVQIWLGMQRATERAIRDTSLREELTNAELRALRAQVNPHFLFNSLNTIADLAVIAPDRAEEMTIRLSAVFRYVLVNTDRHFASLREELEFARTYLHIEQTRFEDRLKVIFDVDAATLGQEIPTLLLQPLIENALKHGLAPRRGGGTLTIRTVAIEDSISISIADDGVGLRRGAEPNQRSTHVGVSNVSKRLQTAYGGRASFTLRQQETGGTEALIVIPKGQEV
jgi:two-component system LytT family sensor kinase